MELNSEIWFKHLEFVLQTIAVFYPMNPNTVSKKKYYDFIQNLPVLFPEYPMGSNFVDLLDSYPVTPYLDSRMSMMKWVHFITNRIRHQQKKPLIEFYDYLDEYYENYKPVEVIEKNKNQTIEKYVRFSLYGLMAIFIVYLYKKQ